MGVADMSLTHRIEVAVPEGTSKTEIGRIFEKFARKLLELAAIIHDGVRV